MIMGEPRSFPFDFIAESKPAVKTFSRQKDADQTVALFALLHEPCAISGGNRTGEGLRRAIATSFRTGLDFVFLPHNDSDEPGERCEDVWYRCRGEGI
jgi:hypothetical protein